MFTIMDIRNIAIQIERNGEAAYLRAGKNVDDPEISRLLELLAAQEKDHAKWFEEMEIPQCLEAQDPQIAEMGREVLQKIMDNQTFSLDVDRLGAVETIYNVLQQSLEFENDTILFYEMLHDFLEEGSAARQKLERIIEEERTHIKQLDKMLSTVEQSRP